MLAVPASMSLQHEGTASLGRRKRKAAMRQSSTISRRRVQTRLSQNRHLLHSLTLDGLY